MQIPSNRMNLFFKKHIHVVLTLQSVILYLTAVSEVELHVSCRGPPKCASHLPLYFLWVPQYISFPPFIFLPFTPSSLLPSILYLSQLICSNRFSSYCSYAASHKLLSYSKSLSPSIYPSLFHSFLPSIHNHITCSNSCLNLWSWASSCLLWSSNHASNLPIHRLNIFPFLPSSSHFWSFLLIFSSIYHPFCLNLCSWAPRWPLESMIIIPSLNPSFCPSI